MKSLLAEAEKQMQAVDNQHKLDLPVENHFAKDIYGRELFIPAGSLVVGKIHKHSSLNILAQGELILITEEGRKTIKAPYTVASEPGIKRLVYTLTDCTWITVHGTDLTDVEAIEEEFIAKDYSDVEYLKETKENLCLGQQ